MKRYRYRISGLVQGVGFRPFVYRLAIKHGVHGFVCNDGHGVTVEGEADENIMEAFLADIWESAPLASRIQFIEKDSLSLCNFSSFRIIATLSDGSISASMPLDRAPCAYCLEDLYNPVNRRFRYPFISCNLCGPRFTIAKRLPFDRINTTMREFPLCSACKNEYGNSHDRRFHAQTICCSTCGPRLSLHSKDAVVTGAAALDSSVDLIRQGKLLAIKGVGGYQLVCSALSLDSINRMRQFKARLRKPFALLVADIREVQVLCELSDSERELLTSAIAPVVILYKKENLDIQERIAPSVAPGLATLGVMLPSTALHSLLAQDSGHWLVVTSANRRGEPMHTSDREAAAELSAYVDSILSHDREIAHLADDSVLRLAGRQSVVLRHARGLAPTEIAMASDHDFAGIGYGGHSKAAFCLADQKRLILGQHIGELGSIRARQVFASELDSYGQLYPHASNIGACDAHPDYGTLPLAGKRPHSSHPVWHHEAHLEALIAEKGFFGRALGIVCDGTGFGSDGSLWGGEFYLIDGDKRQRIGSLLPFRLAGSEKAVKEPRRAALGMLYETYAEKATDHEFIASSFQANEARVLLTMLGRGIHSPYTSSLGRLFDGYAALLGLCSIADYEAEAPAYLESLARRRTAEDPFPINWMRDQAGLWRWDWRNLVTFDFPVTRKNESRDVGQLAGKFHATVVQMIRDLAKKFDMKTVLLTGGVFQNAVLIELLTRDSLSPDLSVLFHDRIPPGDGSLALGQIAVLRLKEKIHVPCSPR